jgi:hypothetical protein
LGSSKVAALTLRAMLSSSLAHTMRRRPSAGSVMSLSTSLTSGVSVIRNSRLLARS